MAREQVLPKAFFWVDQLPKVGGLETTAQREANAQAPRNDLLDSRNSAGLGVGCLIHTAGAETNKGVLWTTFPGSRRAARAP